MYAEITKEIFQKLVPFDQGYEKIERLEHAFKEHYVVDGVRLMVVVNYIGPVTQYYIQDINA